MNNALLQLQQQPLLLMGLCAVGGYLIGSFSFARLVYRLVKKSTDYEPFREPIAGTDEMYESDLISATWVAKKTSKKYGCLTAILDMIKVGVPTLILKLFFPNLPFYLVVAFFGILGHNYPIYYRFKGGRGEASLMGSILVIDWLGMIVSHLASVVLGFVVGSVMVLQLSWKFLIIFWFWFYHHDYYAVLFMVGANVLFWFSMRKDIKMIMELKKKKDDFKLKEEDIAEGVFMGRKMGRIIENYSVVGIIRRLRKKKNG